MTYAVDIFERETLADGDYRPVCFSTVFINEQLFSESNSEYVALNEAIEKLSEEFNCPYIDLYDTFKQAVEQLGWASVYNHDHFHPKSEGCAVVVRCIMEALTRASLIQADATAKD